jgi:predicted ester cyclase
VDLAESKALVRRYYDEVLTGGDRQLLARLLDPSFVSHVSGGPDAGAEFYIAAVDATHAAFPDLVVTVHDQVAEDDKVVTRWSATGTRRGLRRRAGHRPPGRRQRHPHPSRPARTAD